MRERIAQQGQSGTLSVCPHLGLSEDPRARFQEPSSEHRCYLWMQRERIDRLHQKRFCLTTNHKQCPWLSVAQVEPVGSPIAQSWRNLRAGIRDRFDILEHETMRASWPRALWIILVFIVQMIVQLAVEAWRVISPRARKLLPWAKRTAIALVGVLKRGGAFVTRAVTRGASGQTNQVGTSPASAVSPEPAQPATLAESPGGVPIVSVPVVQPSRAPSSATTAMGALISSERWECTSCYQENPRDTVFCTQCGRVAQWIEEEMLARDEFFLIGGIKALREGEEEKAHQFFSVATTSNPESAQAWYWRARTAEDVDEIVLCFEQILRLNPANDEVRRNLELARIRQNHQHVVSQPVETTSATPAKPTRPSMASRVFQLGRHLALEIASIPSFVIGLMFVGHPLADALATTGIPDLKAYIPVFKLPEYQVTLPADFTLPLLSSTFNLGDAIPVVLAIWFVLLALWLSDGASSARIPALASGLVALAAFTQVAEAGRWFLLAGIVLVLLSIFGKGTKEEEINSVASRFTASAA